MYEVILYGHGRRNATTPDGALTTAREMLDEIGDRTLRKDLTITKNGVYDGPLTVAAQRGRIPTKGT